MTPLRALPNVPALSDLTDRRDIETLLSFLNELREGLVSDISSIGEAQEDLREPLMGDFFIRSGVPQVVLSDDSPEPIALRRDIPQQKTEPFFGESVTFNGPSSGDVHNFSPCRAGRIMAVRGFLEGAPSDTVTVNVTKAGKSVLETGSFTIAPGAVGPTWRGCPLLRSASSGVLSFDPGDVLQVSIDAVSGTPMSSSVSVEVAELGE